MKIIGKRIDGKETLYAVEFKEDGYKYTKIIKIKSKTMREVATMRVKSEYFYFE